MSPSPAAGPLTGLIVADFSRVLAGPLATMHLADLGATVVKVEEPGRGDDTRSWGPPYVGDMSTYFASVNRNKRSVALDLNQPADLALARELGRRADVVIENFRPGRLAEFGLGPDELRAESPGLVYCSISGFGSLGGASRPGYDFVVQAVGGLMSITGPTDGEPVKVGVAVVDVLTGLHAAMAVLAALRVRDATGQGQHVEVNLLSSLLSSLVNQGSAFINGGGEPQALGNQHPSIAPYETLRTKDGSLAVAVGNDRQFLALAREIGRPELAVDDRFATNPARVANRAELVALLERALGVQTAAVWAQRLGSVGVPCGPVQSIGQAIALAEELGLAPVVRSGESAAAGAPPIATLASPLTLHGTPVRYERPPPALDADGEQVRAWLAGSGGVLS